MKNFSDATNYPVKVIFADEKKPDGLRTPALPQ